MESSYISRAYQSISKKNDVVCVHDPRAYQSISKNNDVVCVHNQHRKLFSYCGHILVSVSISQ